LQHFLRSPFDRTPHFGGRKMKAILIKKASVYAPEHLGVKDILLIGGTIAAIDAEIPEAQLRASGFDTKVLSVKNAVAIPGFIDQHLHFNGAGGEGGAIYRTPPTQLSTLLRAGITSAVGLLGTDGCCRSLRELLMKAKALDAEGISTWIYTGAYQLPGPLLTEDIMSDLMLVDKVIGLKIACSDHRSSSPCIEKLREAFSATRVGGILSGKAGVIMIHIGEGPDRLEPLHEAVKGSDVPISQLVPTHLNRSRSVLEECIKFGRAGGYVDFSTGVAERYNFAGAIDPAKAYQYLVENGVNPRHITFSTDGNGVMTKISCTGEKIPLMAPVDSLHGEFVRLADSSVSMEDAVRVTSTNAADHLQLWKKGHLSPGMDADILLLDEALNISALIAKGTLCMENFRLCKKGLFE